MNNNLELELICDSEAVDMLRRNIRGGLSFINRRLVELTPRFGAGSLSRVVTELDGVHTDIVYVDANNLYG